MTRILLDTDPQIEAELSAQNPLGRFGRPDELRGAALWLASDASTFCTGSEFVYLMFLCVKMADRNLFPASASMEGNVLGERKASRVHISKTRILYFVFCISSSWERQ
jgi:hypothetical protein